MTLITVRLQKEVRWIVGMMALKASFFLPTPRGHVSTKTLISRSYHYQHSCEQNDLDIWREIHGSVFVREVQKDVVDVEGYTGLLCMAI